MCTMLVGQPGNGWIEIKCLVAAIVGSGYTNCIMIQTRRLPQTGLQSLHQQRLLQTRQTDTAYWKPIIREIAH